MRRTASIFLKCCTVSLATLLVLEGALQLAFPLLPQILIEQMPQYLERSGYRLETAHGAREYPAHEAVDFQIELTSGDLYRLTCLSPESAPPFESYGVAFKRDAHGFRNDQPWPEQLDLVVLGDSFVAAEAINLPFWHALSQSQLVLGLPGSGTLEQQRLFAAFAVAREPKTIVLAFFGGNDLADTADYAEMLNKGESFSTRAHKGKHLLDYSVLLNLALTLRDALSHGEETCHYPQMAMTDPPTPVAFYDEFLPALALSAKEIRESDSFLLTRASITEMTASQLARGGRFVLMYIPQKAEVYWSRLNDGSKQAIVSQLEAHDEVEIAESIDANLSVQRSILHELTNELGIEFLDLTAPLAAAIAQGEQPYFFADTHWNQVGHNIARIALLERLNRSNLDT